MGMPLVSQYGDWAGGMCILGIRKTEDCLIGNRTREKVSDLMVLPLPFVLSFTDGDARAFEEFLSWYLGWCWIGYF